MKTILASISVWLASLAIACGYTLSGSVYKTDGSQSDVQAALSEARDGSVIELPSGSFNWSSGVTSDSAVTIQGQGASSTSVTNGSSSNPPKFWCINLQCGESESRVSGIAFKGQYGVDIHSSPSSAVFRVDNCSFDCGTVQGVLLQIWGNGKGLVDHCSFSGGGGSEMIHNMGMGGENPAGWEDNVYPGTDKMVFIENCTFSKNPMADPYFWGTSALQGYYGSRTVMRYNKLNYAHIDQHGNVPPLYGARWWEFYDNTFYVPPEGNQSDYFGLRGGSGVVFNTHVTGGPNWGSGALNLYTDEKVDPPLCGPGAGIFDGGNRTNSPVYFWANGSLHPSSGSATVVANRDYFDSASQPTSMKKRQLTSDTNSTTYSYKPYVYPHPLDDGDPNMFVPGSGGGGGPGPSPTPTPQPSATPTPQPSATPTPPLPTPTPAPSATPIVIEVPYPSTITIQPKH